MGDWVGGPPCFPTAVVPGFSKWAVQQAGGRWQAGQSRNAVEAVLCVSICPLTGVGGSRGTPLACKRVANVRSGVWDQEQSCDPEQDASRQQPQQI